MKAKFTLLICTLLGSYGSYAQWGPIPALKGCTAPQIWAEGQDILVQGDEAESFFLTRDFGNTWQVLPFAYRCIPFIWNGNLIHNDSLNNVVIDHGFTGSDVILSSYFDSLGVYFRQFQYSNGRFFLIASSRSMGYYSLYYSDDTCATWHPVTRIPNYPSMVMRAVNGYVYVGVAGGDTLIYASSNNGNTWNPTVIYQVQQITDIDARDSFVVLGSENSTLSLLYSSNAGDTFIMGNNTSDFGGAGVAIGDSGTYISPRYPYGLAKFNYQTGQAELQNIAALPDSSGAGVYYDQGRIIIATESAGIYWLDEATGVIHNFNNPVDAQWIQQVCVDSNQLLTLSQWSYIGALDGCRSQYTYSNNYGSSFRSKYVYYSNSYVPNIMTQMLIDTTLYILSFTAGNGSDTIELERLTPQGPQVISGDTALKGGEYLFHVDSTIFVITLNINFNFHYSTDGGITWTLANSVYDPYVQIYYQVAGDTAYIYCAETIYVYTKHGQLAYQVYTGVPETSFYYPSTLWVTDTAFIINNGTGLYSVSRNGNNINTIALASDFNGSMIMTAGLWHGYYFLSVDTQGAFVLSPDSSTWFSFNQGLKDQTPFAFYFNDSSVYAHLTGSEWVWQRKLSDLAHPNVTTAINEPPVHNQFEMYPNPASHSVEIKTLQPVDAPYTIYNMQGKIMCRGLLAGSSALVDISNFAAATYIVRLDLPKISLWSKLVVQH